MAVLLQTEHWRASDSFKFSVQDGGRERFSGQVPHSDAEPILLANVASAIQSIECERTKKIPEF